MNDQAITGGCLCGKVRYMIAGTVGPASYCHCEDCRWSTGSAFNIGIRTANEGFKLTCGAPRHHTKTGDSGNSITRHFCGDCGSPIYSASPVHPDHVFVRAGTLDDPTVVGPTHQSWLDSAVSWAFVDNSLKAHKRGRET